MEVDVTAKINEIFGDSAYRIVLSKAVKNSGNQYDRIALVCKDSCYQAECFTKQQAFHFNYTADEAKSFCEKNFGCSFLQLNAWSDRWEYQISVKKKGKVFFNRRMVRTENVPKKQTEHNRKKNYLLPEGEFIPPLLDMGVITEQGKIRSHMQDKYRQINRFLEIIEDAVRNEPFNSDKPLKIVDFGCGKSYLTFVLYYYFHEVKHMNVDMTGLDLKEDVISKCNETAKKYGYKNLTFQVGDIGAYSDSVPADMVITLHACDTATDYALFHAIKWGARMIFSVPCCQHELNKQFLAQDLEIIGRYGIVKERTMALFTDAIRANLLECCGYKTQLMEFVDFENTPKNLLIRAVNRKTEPARIDVTRRLHCKKSHYREVRELMERFHLNPTLYKLLAEAGYIKEERAAEQL